MNLPFDVFTFCRDSLLMILAWFLLAISYFSWGRFFSKILNINISGNKGLIKNIWLGWTFSIFFFSIYHLFLPINLTASIVFFIPAIIFFLIKYSIKLPYFLKSIGWLKLTAIIFTIFAASAVSIQLPLNFDTGYYHLNSIRWANECHIVKGIGNLHDRLGFNQLYFLYAASLNFHPFLNDYAFHAANGFLYAIYAVGMILGGTFIDLLLLCLFFFIPMPYYWINNPTPDIASTLIQIFVFKYLLEVFFYNSNSKERSSYIAFAAVLSAFMVCIKLSNAILALGFGITTFLFTKKFTFEQFEKKIIQRSFVFIVILFTIWIIRGYIQTGYLAYPSSIGKINFAWTVPERIALNQRNSIYASARTCGQSFDINEPMVKNNEWFEFWFKWNFIDTNRFFIEKDLLNNIKDAVLLIVFPMTEFMWGTGSLTMFITSIILFIVWLATYFKNKELLNQSYILLSLLIIEFLSIVIWFITVPDFRFANGMFILLFVTSILMTKAAYPKLQINKKIKTFMMFYSVLIFIWCFSISYSMGEFGFCGMITLKKLPMKTFVTNSGLKLLVPAQGKQPWDSDLPATPEPEKNLVLFSSTINDGFYINE